MVTVNVHTDARDNAELIAHCATLGYLRADLPTLDASWGYGKFWTRWRPDFLIGLDNDPLKAEHVRGDFTALPFPDGSIEQVILDPPYKLNGTSTGRGPSASDEQYGVHAGYETWQDRHTLINRAIIECLRVTRRKRGKPGGWLFVKCQDQVCSGAKRWQTHEFARTAETNGGTLVDQLQLPGSREQPAGRQAHARQNFSTLLIVRRRL